MSTGDSMSTMINEPLDLVKLCLDEQTLQHLQINDMPTKFKMIVIKSIIQATVPTYSAKCGKSAAMVRLRQELSLTDLNRKTALARTRAFSKWINSHT
ncbi:hypothetical protein BB561_001712 [Smittium simulii]|uniref:Uncharacterized protein n=1 Tax=Smittium simulii TaxID=133385 RepID=A0A2T9YTB7_9FUNG|nr:hypothetical protein BB561_001712 [Smittium simulii]